MALYVALAMLFVIAVTYQVRALEQIFPQWFGVTLVQWPFYLDAEDQPHFIVQFALQNARAAGFRNGETLIAINSVPITSRSIYSDILASSHPGDINVTYRRKGEPLNRHAKVALGKVESLSLLHILFYAALPAERRNPTPRSLR